MSRVIDLNGDWEIRADPDDRGLRDRWFQMPSPSKSASEGSGTSTPWLRTHVPSAWQHTLGPDYHGIAWYRRRVEIPPDWLSAGTRLWLRFDSVATDCTVWASGIELGRHIGDYLPFQLELSLHRLTLSPSHPLSLDIVLRIDEIRATRPPPGVTTENGHITKGFHDVLSLQHGGVWGNVSLRRTGPVAFAHEPRIATDARTGDVQVAGDVDGPIDSCALAVELLGPDGARVAQAESRGARVALRVPSPRPWSPDSPALYAATVRLLHDGKPSDEHRTRFAFRTVTTGGPEGGNRSILLNGQPLCIRGVLHWGHEPNAMAPAPPPEQVRAEFTRLKQMGFNCVCLCMWYPPEYYFDIADEMGMLLWQEHPVWKSPMEGERIPEYQRLFDGFFRRDRRHPSVVIVSGSCEHERIHPELAAWWWKRAKEELPDRLVQVQTAFLAWTNPDQTDLHDEHVYESSGRWVKFLEDLQLALAELPPKPFVMGETVIGTAWADTRTLGPGEQSKTEAKAPGTESKAPADPWWTPKGLAECRAFERWVVDRYGAATLDRFKRHAHRNNLLHRKFQSEVFRSYPNHAGWVMNQIRDVPNGRLGFMDELDRWRFAPDETRPWLADRIAILRPPDWRAGFTGGRRIDAGIGIANFGPGPLRTALTLDRSIGAAIHANPIASDPGAVAFTPVAIDLPRVESPTPIDLRASAPGLEPNTWRLWALPDAGDVPAGVVRLDGIPFDARDRDLDFEERAYSSGWGLVNRTWKPVLPFPETVLFRSPLWRFDGPMPPGTRLVVTHKLTTRLIEFMRSAGRVIWLAAGRTRGSLPTKFVTLWGQCPFVPETGPLGPMEGDPPGGGVHHSDWVVDLLHHDLTRRYTRAIPIEEMPIGAYPLPPTPRPGDAPPPDPSPSSHISLLDHVDPIVRYVFTHDRGVPKFLDAAFMTRVGRGLLIATSLDHTEDAGQYLLRRFIDFSLLDSPLCRAELDPEVLRAWAI